MPGASASLVTPRSNKLVNTDAQGCPLGRYAPCAPLRGRGLHAR